MKSIKLFFAAFAALMAVSCEKGTEEKSRIGNGQRPSCSALPVTTVWTHILTHGRLTASSSTSI